MPKRCLSCGKESPDNSNFCQYCGSSEFEDSWNQNVSVTGRRCFNCGREMDDDAIFCQYCGSRNEFKRIDTNVYHPVDTRGNGQLFVEPKKRSGKGLIAVLAIVLFVALLGGGYFIYSSLSLKEVDFHNGEHVIRDSYYYSGARADTRNTMFTVNAPSDENVYVYIRESENGEVYSYLVKKNESHSIYLSDGYYEVYYATGDKWYGEKKLFGKSTTYYVDTASFSTYDLEEGYYWLTRFEPLDESIVKISKSEFPSH